MTDTQPVSEKIREAILKNEASYALAGLWSGGVVAIVNSSGDRPSLYFQVHDPQEDWEAAPKLPQGLEIKGLSLDISGVDSLGVSIGVEAVDSLEPFLSLVDYLFDQLVFRTEAEGKSHEVYREVSDWIDFWKVSGKKPMREAVMGLVGELLTITSLLDHRGLNHDAWEGPGGGNHDFRAFGNSMEVKVCGSRSGGLVHKISSQRQLEAPEHGRLFLHSLRLQLGKNLPHKVDELIQAAKTSKPFSSSEAASFFDRSLELILGGMSVPQEISTYELLDQHLFEVDENFPRLEGNLMPKGVIDVTYSIDLTSMADEETRCLRRSFSLESCDWA